MLSFGTAVVPDQMDPMTHSREGRRHDDLTRESLAWHETQEALARLNISRRPSNGRQVDRERSLSVTPSSTSISEGPNEEEEYEMGKGKGRERVRTSQRRKEGGQVESGANVDRLPNEVLSIVSVCAETYRG